MRFPTGYGTPSKPLAWATVRDKLTAAEQYWLGTTRPDGRPHVVPVDGLWVDDAWYFGGAPATVHQRNLRDNQTVAMHLPDPMAAVIAEGTAEWVVPGDDEKRALAQAFKAKYAKYGYPDNPDQYAHGTWRLRPTVVLAWERLDKDATRFRF